MKLALIGHGAMNKLVEQLARDDNHEIAVIVHEADAKLSAAKLSQKLGGADTAIDFSIAAAVKRNVEACALAKVPLVEGTTGWHDELETVKSLVVQHNGALVYGANFSVGVNLFYRIADFAAELFAKFEDYETFVEEQHHSRKKDAPSGTALKLEAIVKQHYQKDFTIAATRAGHIPGTHRVGFDSAADQILLEHTARNREGFARGALVAASWIAGKTGVYEFTDLIRQVMKD